MVWFYFYQPYSEKFSKWSQELLALGERIGKVNTGLSEETITSKLKTRTYSTFVTNINLEEVAPIDQGPDSCIICQVILFAYIYHTILSFFKFQAHIFITHHHSLLTCHLPFLLDFAGGLQEPRENRNSRLWSRVSCRLLK